MRCIWPGEEKRKGETWRTVEWGACLREYSTIMWSEV